MPANAAAARPSRQVVNIGGREVEVDLPITINEYAELHTLSRTTVRKWIGQGRLFPVERRGGGASRAAAVLLWTAERPDRVAPGSLTPDQRAGWKNK